MCPDFRIHPFTSYPFHRVRNPFVSEAKPRKRSKGGGDDDAMTVKKRKISEAE
jgi:hypothetical protein